MRGRRRRELEPPQAWELLLRHAYWELVFEDPDWADSLGRPGFEEAVAALYEDWTDAAEEDEGAAFELLMLFVSEWQLPIPFEHELESRFAAGQAGKDEFLMLGRPARLPSVEWPLRNPVDARQLYLLLPEARIAYRPGVESRQELRSAIGSALEETRRDLELQADLIDAELTRAGWTASPYRTVASRSLAAKRLYRRTLCGWTDDAIATAEAEAGANAVSDSAIGKSIRSTAALLQIERPQRRIPSW